MRGASLTYNGIQIALVKTNMIDAKSVYTDDGVDFLWTEVTIDVDGLIAPTETAYAGSPPVYSANTLPPVTYNAIQARLNQPRGVLTFTNFMTTMFSTPTNGSSDVNNGPFPINLRIKQIDGGKAFHINYQIRFCVSACTNNTLISHRFSQEQDIDEHFYTVSVTNGVVHFRVDLLDNSGLVADAFRTSMLPPIPPGFRREKIHFGVDSKRNVMTYSCVDREQAFDLGDTGVNGDGTFVTKAEGIYRVSTMPSQHTEGKVEIPSPMNIAVMTMRLWGSKQASNWVMTQLAFSVIASTKMKFNLPDRWIRSVDITQSLTERFVEVTIAQTIIAQGNGPFFALPTSGLQLDNPLSAKNGISPVPPGDNGTRGTASLALLSSQLTAACGGAVAAPCNETGADGGTASYGGPATPAASVYCGPAPAVSVEPINYIPSQPSKYKYAGVPITSAKVKSRYGTSMGRIHSRYGYTPPDSTSPGSPPGGGSGSPPGDGSGSPQPGVTPNSVVFTTGLPKTTRVVEWECESAYGPPQIPAPESSNPNMVLMDYEISPLDLQLMPDSTPLFTITGKYVYAMLSDLGTVGNLAFDIPQWVNIERGQYGLVLSDQDGNYSHGLIDNATQDPQV